MYDELVKRLKEDKSWVEQGTTQTEHEIAEHIQQAADAIEELTGFVQEAERDRDEYRERLDKANDAIEELQQIADHYEETAKDYFKDVCYYLERMPKWIPVTERLPSEDGFTLIFTANGHAGVCYFTNGWWGGYGKDGITHWMPLPQPPKDWLKQEAQCISG